MPDLTITNPETGESKTVSLPRSPTGAEIEEIGAQLFPGVNLNAPRKPTPKPKPKPKPVDRRNPVQKAINAITDTAFNLSPIGMAVAASNDLARKGPNKGVGQALMRAPQEAVALPVTMAKGVAAAAPGYVKNVVKRNIVAPAEITGALLAGNPKAAKRAVRKAVEAAEQVSRTEGGFFLPGYDAIEKGVNAARETGSMVKGAQAAWEEAQAQFIANPVATALDAIDVFGALPSVGAIARAGRPKVRPNVASAPAPATSRRYVPKPISREAAEAAIQQRAARRIQKVAPALDVLDPEVIPNIPEPTPPLSQNLVESAPNTRIGDTLEPWQMKRADFSASEDVFSHAQPDAERVAQIEAEGLRLTDTLRKHVRPDNITAVDDVPLSGWVLRGTDNPYGSNVALFRLKPGSRIAREGTPEFKKLTKGLKPGMVRMQTAAPDIVARAKAAGYDAVEFEGTNVGTLVINPDAMLSHRQMVAQALAEGKPVPPEVLADYPDLQTTTTPTKEPFPWRGERIPLDPDLLDEAANSLAGVADEATPRTRDDHNTAMERIVTEQRRRDAEAPDIQPVQPLRSEGAAEGGTTPQATPVESVPPVQETVPNQPASPEAQQTPPPQDGPDWRFVDGRDAPPPPRGEDPAVDPDAPSPIQGLKMRDVEAVATRNNFALPSRESMREGWDAVRARAERDYGEIVPALKNYDKEVNPGITREEAHVGLVRLRELTDSDIPRVTGELAALPENSKRRIPVQQRLDELTKEAGNISEMLWRSGSDAGRRLQFQKIYATGPFDAATILKKAQAATRGGLTPQAQQTLIRLAERGKAVETGIDNRLRQEGEAAAKRLEQGEAKAATTKKPAPRKKGEPVAFAANNTVFTAERLEAARARFRAKAGRLNSNFDPEILRDIVEIGGYYIEGGLRHKPTWLATMRRETPGVGDDILGDAWTIANREVRLRASAEKTLSTIADKDTGRASADAVSFGASEYAKGARDLKAFAARIRQRFGERLGDAFLDDLFRQSAEKYRREQGTVNKIRQEMAELVGKEAYKSRSLLEKSVLSLRDLMQAPTSLAASVDFSGVLRQGGVLVAANPRRAATSLMPMFKAAWKGGSKVADEVADQIRSRANWENYERAGLDITDYDARVDLSKAEENFRSQLAQRIPWVRASDRAYVTFLNKLRADTMDAFLDDLAAAKGDNRDFSDGELKVLGNAINVLSGRGNLYGANRAAGTLSAFFFSPRFVMSRFQTLTAQPIWYGTGTEAIGAKGTGAARKIVAKTYGRAMGTLALVMGLVALAKLMGARIDVEDDPRSSDFAKVRVGKTRFDPWGGMQQFVVLGSRLWTGEQKGVYPNSADSKDLTTGGYGEATRLTVALKFVRSKLAPVPGAAWTALDANTTFAGDRTSPGAIAEGFVTPMSFRDMYNALREEGWGHMAAVAVTNTFGVSGSTYGDDETEHTMIGDAIAAMRGK